MGRKGKKTPPQQVGPVSLPAAYEAYLGRPAVSPSTDGWLVGVGTVEELRERLAVCGRGVRREEGLYLLRSIMAHVPCAPYEVQMLVHDLIADGFHDLAREMMHGWSAHASHKPQDGLHLFQFDHDDTCIFCTVLRANTRPDRKCELFWEIYNLFHGHGNSATSLEFMFGAASCVSRQPVLRKADIAQCFANINTLLMEHDVLDCTLHQRAMRTLHNMVVTYPNNDVLDGCMTCMVTLCRHLPNTDEGFSDVIGRLLAAMDDGTISACHTLMNVVGEHVRRYMEITKFVIGSSGDRRRELLHVIGRLLLPISNMDLRIVLLGPVYGVEGDYMERYGSHLLDLLQRDTLGPEDVALVHDIGATLPPHVSKLFQQEARRVGARGTGRRLGSQRRGSSGGSGETAWQAAGCSDWLHSATSGPGPPRRHTGHWGSTTASWLWTSLTPRRAAR